MNKKNLFYGFIGQDTLTQKETLEKYLKQWQSENSDGLIKTHYGDEFNFQNFLQDFTSPSLFSENTLILIKNIEHLNISYQKKILSFLEKKTTEVFLLVSGLNWSSTGSLRKWFNKNGQVQEFKQPWPNQIPQWIIERSQTIYQRPLVLATAHRLWEYLGENLEQIDQELSLLNQALPPKKSIEITDLEHHLHRHRDHSIFELLKNFGLRQKKSAMICLNSLIEQNEPPFFIASRLFTHFCKLYQVFLLQQQHISIQQITDKLKINRFIFQKEDFIKQSQSRSLKHWEKSLIKLAELEWQLKRGVYTQRFEMEIRFLNFI